MGKPLLCYFDGSVSFHQYFAEQAVQLVLGGDCDAARVIYGDDRPVGRRTLAAFFADGVSPRREIGSFLDNSGVGAGITFRELTKLVYLSHARHYVSGWASKFDVVIRAYGVANGNVRIHEAYCDGAAITLADFSNISALRRVALEDYLKWPGPIWAKVAGGPAFQPEEQWLKDELGKKITVASVRSYSVQG